MGRGTGGSPKRQKEHRSNWDAFESEKGLLEIILGEQTETRTNPSQLRGMVTFPPRFRGEAEKVRDKEEEGVPSLP